MTFRVPYYVGRLNAYKGHHEQRPVWVKRTEDGERLVVGKNGKKHREAIAPWNFDSKIDRHASNRAFMERMIRTCTYIQGAPVLPRHSIVYSQFAVLNELNGLRVNGDRVSVKVKQEIYTELFKKNKKVSVKKLVDFLKAGNAYGYEDVKKDDIAGIDIKGNGFNNSLASYVECFKIFDKDIEDAKVLEVVERVLEWQALNENKQMVQELIWQNYSNLPIAIQQSLGRLNFSGFGNLSEKFLNSKEILDKESDTLVSIAEIMWGYNLNLMEILHSSRFDIQSWLDRECSANTAMSDEELVAQSYASPSVKRAVRQAMQVVDEISGLVGRVPDKIFMEVTRSNQKDMKRTVSRKQQLREMYKEYAKINQNLAQDMERELDGGADKKGVNEKQLKSKHLYLYFRQCGKCAYSGDPINISDILRNSGKYDIDHIIPQSFKKDDGLSNLVLAKSEINRNKKSTYPISAVEEINKNRGKLVAMWEGWCKSGLMSAVKLARLKRTAPLTESEKYEFVSRQLVTTAQSATIVAKLLKQKFSDAEILYSKAENVSDFRNRFGILKSREVNDHHHAHDAYLNIVVGNVYHTKFSKSFWKMDDRQRLSANRIFDWNVTGAWVAPTVIEERNGTIETVDRAVGLKSVLVTKKLHSGGGEFYDQTIYPAHARQKEIERGHKSTEVLGKNSALIRRKGSFNPLSNAAQYGGFKSANTAYFMIVQYSDKKGGSVKRFEQVPAMDKKRWQGLTQEQQESELSVRNPKFKSAKIVEPKILMNSLFEIGPLRIRISGCNETNIQFHNYNQWLPSRKFVEYVRVMSEYMTKISKAKRLLEAEDFRGKEEFALASKNKPKVVSKIVNLELYDEICDALDRMYGSYPTLKGKSLGIPDMYDRLVVAREEFIKIDITEQLVMLDSLVKGMGCNPNCFDLSAVGGVKDSGKIQPTRSIGLLPLVLVRESVTGLFTKRIVIVSHAEVGK